MGQLVAATAATFSMPLVSPVKALGALTPFTLV